ncbi:penicillin-binding transpeptidase domain-containing protein [Rubrivirga sp.]|uniref:penicillin-binding transpeptidase domain-containing protein n=1 Tax=Rubrivirga sp. TaxID=1885344 RepID=UPI003B51A4C0
MSRLLPLLLVLAACARPAAPPAASDSAQAPPDSVADWSAAFRAEGAVGTFVLLDTRTGRTTRHDPERAATRFSPASTSKVFNGLVFLDRGVVTDVDSMHAWDGVERSIPQWNRDHSLRTGTAVSAVWLFQRLAGRVGRDGYAEVFAREPYGNSALGDSLELSWLDGTWRVSADEQVVFLDRLRRGDLAFSDADQVTVRDILPILAEGVGTRLKAKTGWGVPPGEPAIGWIVGWVERPDGDAVFAMNAEEAPGLTFDVGPGRLRIVRAVLEGEGLWPAGDGERP